MSVDSLLTITGKRHKETRACCKRRYNEAAGGLNTVIHCRAGIGRTGIVAAGVLLHCGFEPMKAFEHISRKRGASVLDTQEQRSVMHPI